MKANKLHMVIIVIILLSGLAYSRVEYAGGKIIFQIKNTEAKSIIVTGNFLNWNPQGLPLKRDGDLWKGEITLEPGSYEYKFIIDGTWKEDPDNPWKVPDGFGGFNSKFLLTNDGSISFEESQITSIKLASSPLKSVEYKDGKIYFRFYDQKAKEVYLAGTFNNWSPNALKMENKGAYWETSLSLKPGVYEYKYVVDGVWKEDPFNARKVPDGFGGFNSQFELTSDGRLDYSPISAMTQQKPEFTWKGPEIEGDSIIFRFFEPTAQIVYLAGTFNNWAPTGLPMKKDDKGIWYVKVKLIPGNYQYKFVINGNLWKEDPTNPAKVDDGFGGFNSAFRLTDDGKILLEAVTPKSLPQEPIIKSLKKQGTPLYLAIVWHQHQPRYYRDLQTGESFAPWVRLHGIKDYYDMAAILYKYPKIKFTINLTPVLLMQIQDAIKLYDEGKSPDVAFRLTLKNADSLTYDDKKYLLENFFSASWDNMIDIFPRYKELRTKRVFNPDGTINFDESIRRYSTQDFRDLQVYFNLCWFDPDFRDGEVTLVTGEKVSVRKFIEKGRNFSERDKKEILDIQMKILKAIIPVHADLQNRGQIEVITTPYYHPILPLIYDTESAKEAMPNAILPERFSWPEDADWHVKMAVQKYQEIFGKKPEGMWPAEGAVSHAIVPIVRQNGFMWMCSDGHVLARSLKKANFGDDDLYRPYAIANGKDTVFMVFRDTDLSDRIGFRYKSFTGVQGANDLILRLYEIHSKFATDTEPRLVTIILDGENAWEWYKNDAKDFFHSLYSQLSEADWIITTTVGEFLKKYPPRRTITHLHAGSWINADFSTWIGENEENLAWNYLGNVRKDFEDFKKSGKFDTKLLEKAFFELASAEGSDWFWFFGADQSAGDDRWTDIMFRRTLKNVYEILGESAPDYLDKSILEEASKMPGYQTAVMAKTDPRTNARLLTEIKDPEGDDYGPGYYIYPANGVFKKGHFDLRSLSIFENQNSYIFSVKLGEIDNPWNAPYGFSQQILFLYLDYKSGGTKTALKPSLNYNTTQEWDIALMISGWSDACGIFDKDLKLLEPLDIYIDYSNKEVVFSIPKKYLTDIKNAKITLTLYSYDGYGYESLRSLTSHRGEWEFGGAKSSLAPKVIDILHPEKGVQEKALSAYEQGLLPEIPGVAIK
ncbi:MAG: glucodextranase DOMON-like domain-containing protein [candidate division WOR-3 bacterium]